MARLTTHLWCMHLSRTLEEADPGRPIGVYFAQATRYVRSRADGDVFYVRALRHLKAGCPTPRVQDNVTALPAMAGGLIIHA